VTDLIIQDTLSYFMSGADKKRMACSVEERSDKSAVSCGSRRPEVMSRKLTSCEIELKGYYSNMSTQT